MVAADGFDAIVDRTLALLRPLAHERRVDLERRGSCGDLAAGARAPKLRRILPGVLLRAIHTTPRGGRVTVDLGRGPDPAVGDAGGTAPDGVTLVVTYGGPGVSAREAASMSGPFGPGCASDVDIQVALSVSADLARELGGRLRVTSASGEGCRCEVFLPVSGS
jgi:C4-dicarboxylate-specific signal transduction histidine kinase